MRRLLILSLFLVSTWSARSDSLPLVAAGPNESDTPWTVLTLAFDGSWGASTHFISNHAIAGAIANCKQMFKLPIGCGARFTMIQGGWSVGIRCGREVIIVAEPALSDAEKAALDRETELRRHYQPDMPSCVRVVTVDPRGVVIDARPATDSASGGPSWRQEAKDGVDREADGRSGQGPRSPSASR